MSFSFFSFGSCFSFIWPKKRESLFFGDERHSGWLFVENISIWKKKNMTWPAGIATIKCFATILTDVHQMSRSHRRWSSDRDFAIRGSRYDSHGSLGSAQQSRKVRPRGGPRRSWRWSLPPRSALDDNTRRVSSSVDRIAERRVLITEHLCVRTSGPPIGGESKIGRLLLLSRFVSGCLEKSDSLSREKLRCDNRKNRYNLANELNKRTGYPS